MGLSNVISVDGNAVTTGKSEDGRFYVTQKFYDEGSLRRNHELRKAGVLNRGKLGLHDNEDIRYAISVPSADQWQLWKAANPDIYKLIKSPLEHDRMRGCKQLHILKPDWVIMSRS